MSMQLETVVGDALVGFIPDLARLRMTVFREYPYLYDGSEAYEEDYLRTYTASGEAIAVLARDGDAIVGASTGIPLAAETEAFVRPFEALGRDPTTVFYCGESVLLPAWRGRGIYRAFFEAREAYARGLGGMSWISFCGVVRPENHPLRPPALGTARRSVAALRLRTRAQAPHQLRVERHRSVRQHRTPDAVLAEAAGLIPAFCLRAVFSSGLVVIAE